MLEKYISNKAQITVRVICTKMSTLWCWRKPPSLWWPIRVVVKGLLVIVIVTVGMMVATGSLVLLIAAGIPGQISGNKDNGVKQIYTEFALGVSSSWNNNNPDRLCSGDTCLPTACHLLHNTLLRCSTPQSSGRHQTLPHDESWAGAWYCHVTCAEGQRLREVHTIHHCAS